MMQLKKLKTIVLTIKTKVYGKGNIRKAVKYGL